MNAAQRARALEQHRREQLRWDILQVLYVGRPYPLGEGLVLRTLGDADSQAGPAELRRELTYLEDCGLAELTGQGVGAWKARLTAAGVEVVEYQREAPAGIRRPEW